MFFTTERQYWIFEHTGFFRIFSRNRSSPRISLLRNNLKNIVLSIKYFVFNRTKHYFKLTVRLAKSQARSIFVACLGKIPLFFGWRLASSFSSFFGLFDECPAESPTEWSFSRFVGLVGLRPIGVIEELLGWLVPVPVVLPVSELETELPIIELTEIGVVRVSRLE